MVVSLIGATIGTTTTAIKGIQLWVDERKSRKIKIRAKDVEIEISGSVSEQEIEKKIQMFCLLQDNISKEDVKIILNK